MYFYYCFVSIDFINVVKFVKYFFNEITTSGIFGGNEVGLGKSIFMGFDRDLIFIEITS